MMENNKPMSIKYHITAKETAPRFEPVPKLNAMENEGCLGCRVCVKRTSCVYDVYKNKEFNPSRVVDTTDVLCINCMRCVQECKKNILERTENPQYKQLGDSHWRPEIIASNWKQATNGKIPVSGAGYRGVFAGPGFDSIWTDMSEIVRPTRDGIHGREYISTVIELGRRPAFLEFDANGDVTTVMPSFTEIPLPVLLEIPESQFVQESAKQAIAKAAGRAGTFVFADYDDFTGCLNTENAHTIAKIDPTVHDLKKIKDCKIVELADSEKIFDFIEEIKKLNPEIIISVRINLDENALKRVVLLAEKDVGILHLISNRQGKGYGKRKNDFLIELIKEVHFKLLDKSLRDQITLLVSGGIAAAEHIAKIIACGTDGVVLDTALLVAMECRLCSNCEYMKQCPVDINSIPVDYGAQRIVNLLGAWHSQLIEVLGAMGIREVRRLRGELGRIIRFEDLENDSFAPIFGKRKIGFADSLKAAFEGRSPSAKQSIEKTKHEYKNIKSAIKKTTTRYRNSMGIYKVIRTSDCIACGKCAEVCGFGVHIKAGKRVLKPKSHLCRGFDVCRGTDAFCINHCPQNALKIGLDPVWNAFGDPRWPSQLIASTWKEAETGYPPEENFEYKVGESGGGFDRIKIVFPDKTRRKVDSPENVNLSLKLNRRNDDCPQVVTGIPFYGGGMSYGSIGLETMLARAAAYADFDSFISSGEGGFPEELKEYENNVITQVATGLFGVKEETIQRVRIVEFKYAQGAKPGLGGHLLGDKNTAIIAKMRETIEGYPLFSPFPFHSVYSIEDHQKHIDWIKEINPEALVSVKVAGANDIDMVAVGSYYAGAHIIHIDGSYGGTGAAPDIAKKNIAMPLEYAIPKVHRFLIEEGIRDKITLIASGGVRSAWDMAKIIAMGADGVVIGTAEMIALECIRCGACESGRGCPRGIATTDPELSKAYSFDYAKNRLKNMFHAWAVELQNILWHLNMKSVDELVGKSDLLEHLDYE